MSPDLNSLTPGTAFPRLPSSSNGQQQTPRQASNPTSRRASQIFPMNPPPLPLASPSGVLPTSVQNMPFPPLSPTITAESTGSGSGLPIRHPRPMTAAELHLELEKEQEAVVFLPFTL
ncbi:hypothetical protein EJ08DRAFT_652105 [Tothia fuscella]|uniref:Uncharacterized protein n=1 Tax=Tothia fuscella TaxID=1048955 RepID=A0A9P4NKJ5_9PEZI|nr:hypothetical protein EJ08DRAFT_652105 [Tothia fuscella]